MATSEAAVQDYVQKTLLYHSSDQIELNGQIEITIKRLQEQGLITLDTSSTFIPTKLGQAVVASSLTPSDGIFIHNELQKATKAFVIDGDMHALYIFTPVNSLEIEINWQIFRKEMESLDESGLRVLQFVGIKPAKVDKLYVPSVLSI